MRRTSQKSLASPEEAQKKLFAVRLQVRDFPAGGSVIIQHIDGSLFIFRNAFMKRWRGWIFVYWEHGEYQMFSEGSVDTAQELVNRIT